MYFNQYLALFLFLMNPHRYGNTSLPSLMLTLSDICCLAATDGRSRKINVASALVLKVSVNLDCAEAIIIGRH